MSSFLSRFRQQVRSPITFDDSEKADIYERDSTRLTKPPPPLFVRAAATTGGEGDAQRWRYLGTFAPNPSSIRFLRFFLYALTSLSGLATSGVGLAVVQYYNSHGPVIKPSWGSLIAVIVFGIATPGVLFGIFLVTPRLFRPGGVGGILNQTRMELVVLFNMAVLWISGALALACDLRGRENCLWDGYYHYPKPADFEDVCSLIDISVALAYTTFGLAALQMVAVFSIAGYILLYLDQEALTEPTNDLGGRAFRARLLAISQQRQIQGRKVAARRTSTPSPTSSAAAAVRAVPSSRIPPPLVGGGPMKAGTSYRDEEGGSEDKENALTGGSAYYGYESATRV